MNGTLKRGERKALCVEKRKRQGKGTIDEGTIDVSADGKWETEQGEM